MRIALWDIELFSDATARFSDLGWDVCFVSPAQCGSELLSGRVDVALVPSPEVLSDTATYTVLPEVGFSSRGPFPYVSLALKTSILDLRTIRCTAEGRPFLGLASIILREQYERKPSIVDDEGADAELLFGTPIEDAGDFSNIDIGLEWFELTATPLAWGFFATRPGVGVSQSMLQMQERLGSMLLLEDHDASRRDGLRIKYDPEVAEGIDRLVHYLFYMGIIDDIPALRLMAAPDGSATA